MTTDEGYPDTMGAGNVARDDTETLVFADESETCTRDPYCTVHPDEDCPSAFDPGPVPAGTNDVDALRREIALTGDDPSSEISRLVDYVSGYDPEAVMSGLRFIQGCRRRNAARLIET